MEHYSSASIRSVRSRPGTCLRSSEHNGWQSLFVQEMLTDRGEQQFTLHGTEDQALVTLLDGAGRLESDQGGRDVIADRGVGTTGLVPANETCRFKWRPYETTRLPRTVHVYIPRPIMEAAFEEFRHAGNRMADPFLSAIKFADPLLHALSQRLLTGIDAQAPELYAQATAYFLAAHMQTFHKFSNSGKDRRQVGRVHSARIKNVIELMRGRFDQPLRVSELAAEAYVSPFHFSRIFRAATGTTPHRYLIELRMAHAATLLRDTERTIGDIALSCGYQTASAFTTAFRSHFNERPSDFRRKAWGIAPH